MSLIDTLRLGVSIANQVTKPVQAKVGYERYTGDDTYGKRTFASTILLDAIIEFKQESIKTASGQLSMSRSLITLLDVDQVRVATSGNGVKEEDRFTLPDGTTGPVLTRAGFIDPGTGQPLATEVYLG